MSEVLSQAEIDDLLRALTSGDLDATTISTPKEEKRVKDHDFAKPSKFGKEQLRTMEIIFDNYARLVSSFMTGYLRTPTHFEVINSEQLTYTEFNNSLSNPVILAILDLYPLKGSIILEMSAGVGYAIIDKILGGQGKPIEKLRDFSEIEKILLERIVVQLLGFLAEPWETVIDFKPKLEKIETNSQFAQIISPNEMVALVMLSIKLGDVDGMVNFCMPHMTLEPIMSKLNTKFWFGNKVQEDNTVHKGELENRLEFVKVPVRAVLGKTNITVNDFVNLQAGDIIPLDSFINSDLDVMVGNLLKFHCKPGVSRKFNAVQITSVIREGDK